MQIKRIEALELHNKLFCQKRSTKQKKIPLDQKWQRSTKKYPKRFLFSLESP